MGVQGSFWILAGGISGFLAVALGAFGAHGLRDKLDARALEIYHTGAHYQMVHALALVALGIWCNQISQRANLVGYAWLIGTVVFSGSLYALALSGVRGLGAITPIGGVLFLVGWAALAYKAWSSS